MRINRPHHNNMQNRMKKPVVPCEALRNGVAALSYAAAITTSTKMTMAAGPMYFVTEKLDMD